MRAERAEYWKVQVEQWQASGKSCRAWCQEHGLPYQQFNYWKFRFLGVKNKTETTNKLSFVELKPQKPQHAGIDIVYNDFTLSLQQDFDQSTLLRILALIRGMKC